MRISAGCRLSIPALWLLQAAVATAATPFGCLIEPDRVADLGAPVVGVIDSISVDRGDAIAAGQVLAVLRADVERANLRVAETRSRLEADVAAAAANVLLAKQKLMRAAELFAADFISKQGLEQAEAEHELAIQRMEQAKEQVRLRDQELSVAHAQVSMRSVRSPFAGVVVDRFANSGERVEDKPILKVARIDPLRVEVLLPVAHYGSVAAGAELKVTPELPNSAAVTAKVTRVDKVLDAASNTFRVRLVLPNPGNKLPAGLRCKVDLPGGERATASRPAPSPPSPSHQPSRVGKPVDDHVAAAVRPVTPQAGR